MAKPLQMETWLLLTAWQKSPAPYPMVPTPYNLLFNHNTARLAYDNALWPFKVMQSIIFILFESQYATSYNLNSNLGFISHRLATIHMWQTTTDRQTGGRTEDNCNISSTVT